MDRDNHSSSDDLDGGITLTEELFAEAESVLEREPALSSLLHLTILAAQPRTFEEAVAHTVCYRLLTKSCGRNQDGSSAASSSVFCPSQLHQIILDAFASELTEYGHTMKEAIEADIKAVVRRDPAMDTALQVLLFSKGFATLVCHRAAHRLWHTGSQYTAMFLQSQCSAVFGLDIHPAAVIGRSVMLDHGTGVVIGETACVGDGSTLLHGVTLGGTGKDHGDRHPKVGDYVLIGAGSSILGNIRIGRNSKIGAGSVVLRDIPDFATAVGAPAKIIGRVAPTERPGSDMDETLIHVSRLHKSGTVVSLMEQQKRAISNGDSTTVGTADETASESGSEDAGDAGETSASDSICPWRQYAALGKNAPPGTMTLCKLQKLLTKLGCTMTEIGSSFFAMDTHMVGYVKMKVFQEKAAEVIPTYCKSLDAKMVQELVDSVSRGCDSSW